MIVKKIICLSLACIALAACKPSEEKALQLGQHEIANGLMDPDSAKFKMVRFNMDKNQESGDVVSGFVCGRVAGKNGFGAYVGYHPFYVHLKMTSKGMFSKGVSYEVGEKAIYPDGRDESWIDLDGNSYASRCGPTPSE
ncbi:TPA: hypothetical protein ACIR1F_000980 [Enterobacter roggenkampii]